MPIDVWPERIKAIASGIKDVIFAFAAVATIFIQYYNTGKLDDAATAAEQVKSALVVSETKQSQRLDHLSRKADAIATAADASVKNWKAYNTKDPEDMDAAKTAVVEAETKVESVKQ